MKGHRKHRNTGGVNEAAEDMKHKNMDYTAHSNVSHEAEERKHGGRAKRKHGGHVKHHHMGMVKHVGHVEGESTKRHAGRKARKSGGACDSGNPFSSARHGTAPKGRKLDMEME